MFSPLAQFTPVQNSSAFQPNAEVILESFPSCAIEAQLDVGRAAAHGDFQSAGLKSEVTRVDQNGRLFVALGQGRRNGDAVAPGQRAILVSKGAQSKAAVILDQARGAH